MDKRSCNERENKMHQQLQHGDITKKAMFVNLHCQNGKFATAAVKRMISKFEAAGCLDDGSQSGRPSTSANVAQTV